MNSVLYTAIVDGAIDEQGTEASINPSYQEGLNGGETVTIATGLYPGFPMTDMGTITVTIGNNACTNPTPSLSEINSLNITCTTPAQSAQGKYDVTITVDKYDKTYTIDDGYEYKISVPAFFTINTMQEMTHEICTDSNVPYSTDATIRQTIVTGDGAGGTTKWTQGVQGTAQTTLTDSRGGTTRTYTIRKLSDGKCWMTQNLRLAPSSEITLTPDDSDVPSNQNLPAVGTSTTSYNAHEVYEGDYGSTYNATYYSYYSATATQGTNSVSSGFMTRSVCPKGWRMPTGGSGNGTTAETTTGSTTNLVGGDYQALYNQYSSSALMRNTTYGPGFALAGAFNGTSANDGGSIGYYWSSSISTANLAYYLHLNSSYVYPQYNIGKNLSFAVRCVAR